LQVSKQLDNFLQSFEDLANIFAAFEGIKYLEHLSEDMIFTNYQTHWSKLYSSQEKAAFRTADREVLAALQARASKTKGEPGSLLMSTEETQYLIFKRLNQKISDVKHANQALRKEIDWSNA